MTGRLSRLGFLRLALALAMAVGVGLSVAAVGVASGAAEARGRRSIDQEYTAKIKEYTQDPRILTELVDHLPASATVPSPLKFLGRVAGTPDELTYYKDMKRYFEALAKAAPARTRLFTIGQSEEGRDMIVLAIADEATIKTLDKYKKILADLTDPRQADRGAGQALIATGKPIYWATGNLHSGETGSAEMQMELAYRLIVEETPFIQNIRNNEIVFLTPVVEVDGREKVVDKLYYQKKTGQRDAAHLVGPVRRPRQQPGRSGRRPQAHAERAQDLPRVAPDRAPRSARVPGLPVRVHRRRPLQRGDRSGGRPTSGG